MKASLKAFSIRPLTLLKQSNEGFVTGKLDREVGDSREYLIYTEWEDMDSFRKVIASRSFGDVQSYGRTILEGMPRHRVLISAVLNNSSLYMA